MISGCITAVLLLQAEIDLALWSFAICCLLDFLDGLLARLLNQTSMLGKQLDSLADMISFGFVPGLGIYLLLSNIGSLPVWLPFLSFVLTAFSALRLGRFNLEKGRDHYFSGLPTPASALYCIGIVWASTGANTMADTLASQPVFLLGSVLGLSMLLISRVPMFNMKSLFSQPFRQPIRLFFFVLIPIWIYFFEAGALFVTMLTYIILNFGLHLIKKARHVVLSRN